MIVLGIETSCDETAVGIVQDGQKLLSNSIYSSMKEHAKYGGVVPEVAARSHIEYIIPVIQESLSGARLSWKDIDLVSCTSGAGLSGSLLIGAMTAKTITKILNKPLYGANHVLGHLYANFITNSSLEDYRPRKNLPQFPILGLIVSGGHTQLVLFKNHFDYIVLGKTLDDAIGEAFDKVAKILGLDYPGGVEIAKIALKGDKNSFNLPEAKIPGYNFSFSGLKTAVLRLAQKEIGENYTFPSINVSSRLNDAQKANIAASFQYSAIKSIIHKTSKAISQFKPKSVIIAGGVAANQVLREELNLLLDGKIEFPDIKLCTDNGAMVACLGFYLHKYKIGLTKPEDFRINPSLLM